MKKIIGIKNTLTNIYRVQGYKSGLIQEDKLDGDKLKNVPSDLKTLRRKVDKLDIDELVLVPADLSKLNDAVKMMFLKRCV